MTALLDLSIFNQHAAIVGRTGSGKTYTAKGFVERLLDAGRRVCIIDPTDSYWGLRSSADGNKPGYPVVVFGGDHADVPVNARSGHALAEFVATQNAPCVIATADMRIDERRQFMADFLDGLYRLNKQPLHLIVDEADEIGPQNPMPDTKVVLHRIDRIVRRGRIRGFRVMMITQRPAVLNKNLLTQASTLIAMRLMAPQDRKAIDAWIEGQGDVAKGKEVLATLATLKRGEGWVWSPEFGILHRTAFPRIKTFDSSRAPEEGETAEPTRFADVDLSAVRQAFAEAEKEAEANDPKLLRARIVELERQIKQGSDLVITPVVDEMACDQAHAEGYKRGFAGAHAWYEGRIGDILQTTARLADVAEQLRANLIDARDSRAPMPADKAKLIAATPPRTVARPFSPAKTSVLRKPPSQDKQITGFPGPQQRILDALAWLESVGIGDANRTQLALLADASPTSSAYVNNLGALRTAGLIDYPGSGMVMLTDAGRHGADLPERPPTTDDLYATLQRKLSTPQWRILSALIKTYPRSIAREHLADRAEASSTSSAYVNNLGALRSLGFVDYPERGQVVALPVLFLEGR
jgi:ABC-type dipeptide/oligopeptide/nickel transport system ATPase component